MKRPLTERETQVLAGVQRGLLNKVIAAELGIAEPTVKVHLKKLFRHYGVTKRTQLVAMGRPSDLKVGALLDALREIAAHRPYPALIASRALKDYGESL